MDAVKKETAIYTPATTHAGAVAKLIALGQAAISLTSEGKQVTRWKRDDVQFIGRGVKHESKNTGGKPIDFLFVAIK